MTCREAIDALPDYLSDDLPASQRLAFAAHLAECPVCVAYVKSYAATAKLSKSALQDPDAAVPDDMPEELVQAILTARRKPS